MTRQATALIDAENGRAVIQGEDGMAYLLRIDKPGVLQDARGFHLGSFLQSTGAPLEERDAGVYPYADIVSYLDLAYRRQRTLLLFLMTLDSELSIKLRHDVAREVEKFLADDKVSSWLEEIFLQHHLPTGADIENGPKEGKVGAILAKAMRK